MADIASLFNLVAPFFGLILLGFLIGRYKRLPGEGLAWMQFFLIYVALPCLFYRLIADKPLSELTNWRSFFTEGALDKEVKGEKAEVFFKYLRNDFRRSQVILDVYHQTKDESDKSGGYFISTFKAV